MGLWNATGRWLVWAIGLLLVIFGANFAWHGLDIVQVERGWTAVIAGTTIFSTGILTILLGLLIDRVEALRVALLMRRALPHDSVEAPLPAAEAFADPEPPRPIEVPVEPPQAAESRSFSFKPFGKRRVDEAPAPVPEAIAEPVPVPQPEPAAEPAPEMEAQRELPEQIRRFAPPHFRRPTIVPPVVEVESVPQAAVEDPVPEPPVEVLVAPHPVPEEVHLPRAASLPPLQVVEPAREEPAQERPVEPSAEATPAEPATSQHAIAQTHAWLEKALAGGEEEPGLDWLRQRRGTTEERPERKLPSFMRRHSETDQQADSQPEQEIIAPEPPSDQAQAGPSVVGRYSANGSEYTLYANGTIDAQTPLGPRHFASMTDLRKYLETVNAVN